MLYGIVIFASVTVFSAVHSLLFQTSFLWAFGVFWLATAVVVFLDALVAGFCRALPKKWFPLDAKFFTISKKEKQFYEKIGIRKWKHHCPDLGLLTGFKKSKIDAPNNLEYVERYLLEAGYGVVGHLAILPIEFLIVLPIFPFANWWAVALPVACVSFVLNVMPICSLRYNSYKLQTLRKALIKKQAKEFAKVA